MSELRQQLIECIRELEHIRHVKTHIAELQQRLFYEENALSVMEKNLAKEQRDVELLESEGLTTMFRKFLGDREEKLEKEREEYLRASLRFNELYKSVGLIRYELGLLSQKTLGEEGLKHRIEVLLRERGEELMRLSPDTARILQSLDLQTDKWHAFTAEIDEAFTASERALEAVRRTEHYLREARQWGQRDMWAGRGPVRGNMKYMAIDRARKAAHEAKHALIHFANELRDVFRDRQFHFPVDIEQFGRFADIFFDNLITDWMVQQKINRSLMNVSATRQLVENLAEQLDEERTSAKARLAELERERKQVILDAQ